MKCEHKALGIATCPSCGCVVEVRLAARVAELTSKLAEAERWSQARIVEISERECAAKSHVVELSKRVGKYYENARVAEARIAALSEQVKVAREENERLRLQRGEPIGTYRCPMLWCGQTTPHSHDDASQQDLVVDRAFLAQDGPIPQRALDAAKLLRRELAAVQGIGPNGSSPEVTSKWQRLGLARQTFENCLFYEALAALGETEKKT